MNGLRLGAILTWRGDVDVFPEAVASADRLGYELIGVGDSPAVQRELYAALAVAATRSQRARIGAMVTNPVTRHPLVTAGGTATIDDLSGGRAFVAIGRGANAVATIGEPPATLAATREYVETVRALLRGERVTWRGRALEVAWLRRPVPVFYAAYGVRSLRLGGAVADGVVIGAADPDLLAACVREVARGAEAAGRDPGTIELWAMVRAAVAETREDARAELDGSLASAAQFALASPQSAPNVPEELWPRIRALQQGFDPSEHVDGGGRNASLLRELDLGDFLARRFAVAGTADDCRDRLRAIAETGVTGVLVVGAVPQPVELLTLFAHTFAR